MLAVSKKRFWVWGLSQCCGCRLTQSILLALARTRSQVKVVSFKLFQVKDDLEFWSSCPLPPFSMTRITGLVECWGSTLGASCTLGKHPTMELHYSISICLESVPPPYSPALWRSAGSSPEGKRAPESGWLMGVCRADSTAKRKRPSTPTPFKPTREAAGSLQREWWQLTRPTLSYHLHYLCRDLLATFSTSGVLSLPYRFGSSSLIGCIFFTLFAYSHSVIQDTLEPREFLLI